MDPISDMLAWVNANRSKAQEVLGVSYETVRRWRKNGQGVSARALARWMAHMAKPIDEVLKTVENTFDNIPNHVRNFKGRDLSVLMPIYRETNVGTMTAAVAIALDLGKERVRYDFEAGDAMIYHSRDRLAHRFLETGAEWSLWIDSDIIPPIGRGGWFKGMCRTPELPDHIANKHVVYDLLGAKKSIIGGTYFGRHKGGLVMSSAMFNQGQASKARENHDEVIEVDWVATGCLLVHRQVYLDIQKKFPDLGPTKSWPYWSYFQPETEGKGEDVAFCHRSKAAGHPVYQHLGIQCAHVGYMAYGSWNTNGGVANQGIL